MKACLLTLPLLGFLIVATAQAEDDTAEDRKAIQGTWVVVSAELDGMVTESSKGDKFIFAGDKATIETKVKKTDPVVFKLDPAKNPKQIDFDDQTPFKGIYELKGDELKLCYGAKRPAEFKSTSALLLVLKHAAGVPASPAQSQTHTNNGITYEIPAQKKSISEITATSYTFTGDTVTIKWLSGDLAINGKNYGQAVNGDKVVISESGIVSVNGKKRDTQ